MPPVLDPAAVAPAMDSWDELGAAARSCVACPPLAESRIQVVPGRCADAADLLIVGEAPGAQEDATGLPFQGKAGQLLGTLLGEAGLDPSAVAYANTLKCRPPRNRTPHRSELRQCRPWLHRQIELLDPLLIVAVGSTAAAWFFGAGSRITDLRGGVRTFESRAVLVSYHPSAAIRFGPRGAPIAALREDLSAAAALVEELRTSRGTSEAATLSRAPNRQTG